MNWKIYLLSIICFSSCMPELPVTSSIVVDADINTMEVNPYLYGITIEEINHGVDGGIYAELIQNRSFEDGVPPLNCPVDIARRTLTTPNGFTIPFMRPDSLPGWTPANKSSFIKADNSEFVNDKTGRSLLVSSTSDESGKGGVIAYGYNGIPLVQGDKYKLSFYLKNPYFRPRTLSIVLTDSIGENISEVYEIQPTAGWNKYNHTFTPSRTTNDARLKFMADSSMIYWLDVVSLFPEKTWNNRTNGQRNDLMEAVKGLNPSFIRFPGGAFVEGYTLGTYPKWHETVGAISERKHFWNVWEYGTTNGTGFHEYFQICEDLNAQPLYVINSGVTNQSRRPRYEDITAMDKLVNEALDAIGYANQSKDSVLGAVRARNGHPDPFNLKFVEIGSENYGQEYTKRFNLFKKAINERYPDITVLSSHVIKQKGRHDWVDQHVYATESFLLSNTNRYSTIKYSRRNPMVAIGEFGLSGGVEPGTMRAAVAEAAFLVGLENEQDAVQRIAYSPLVGNTKFTLKKFPLILFDGEKIVFTPSYYLMQLLYSNRGNEVLRSKVSTYDKPQVNPGRIGIYMFDNSFSFKDSKIDGKNISDIVVKSGDWKVQDAYLIPVPNRWNYMLTGDSSKYNYTFTTNICRTKGSNVLEFRVRDNGLSGDAQDYIGFSIGDGNAEMYRQSGGIKDSLTSSVEFPIKNNEWYTIAIKCKDDEVSFFINNTLVKTVTLSPLPSLVVNAAYDKKDQVLILKVVNTTQHEEKTSISINGLSVHNTVEVIQLTGDAEESNTYADPKKIFPVNKKYTFSIGSQKVYNFPPNSISVMKFAKD